MEKKIHNIKLSYSNNKFYIGKDEIKRHKYILGEEFEEILKNDRIFNIDVIVDIDEETDKINSVDEILYENMSIDISENFDNVLIKYLNNNVK